MADPEKPKHKVGEPRRVKPKPYKVGKPKKSGPKSGTERAKGT